MDYGKFKYETAQKAKESRRKTSQISIKEMKYRVKIGPGDFDTKTSKVKKFLEEGHKVKITIMFRGREVHHPELGMRILDRVAVHNGHLAKIEASPKLDGRNMTMVLAPDKRVQAAAEAARKKLAADQRRAERNGTDGNGTEVHGTEVHGTETHGAEGKVTEGKVADGNLADGNGGSPVGPAANGVTAAAVQPDPTAVGAGDDAKEG